MRMSWNSMRKVIERGRAMHQAPLPSLLNVFRVKAANVEVLHKPSEFYDRILEGISGAERRVVLCALYLGTGELEKDLTTALEQRHASTPDLQSLILLDANRGTRGGKKSSASMLTALRRDFPLQSEVNFFHTPLLHGLKKRWLPTRANEVVGVQHMKFFIFDDDVICSGANLSTDYFTNRQDRYIVVRNQPSFANYCRNIVNTVGSCSYRLEVGSGEDGNGYTLSLADGCPSPSEAPREFVAFAGERVENFLRTERLESGSSALGTDELLLNGLADPEEALIAPTLEMWPLGIDHDRNHLVYMLSMLQEGRWFLATAYFNVSHVVTQAIAHSAAAWSVLTASPRANGFFGAKGLAGYIPDMYRSNLLSFLRSMEQKQAGKASAHEFWREHWTFHGKGLWWYPIDSSSSLPCMTVFGSSNFGLFPHYLSVCYAVPPPPSYPSWPAADILQESVRTREI